MIEPFSSQEFSPKHPDFNGPIRVPSINHDDLIPEISMAEVYRFFAFAFALSVVAILVTWKVGEWLARVLVGA